MPAPAAGSGPTTRPWVRSLSTPFKPCTAWRKPSPISGTPRIPLPPCRPDAARLLCSGASRNGRGGNGLLAPAVLRRNRPPLLPAQSIGDDGVRRRLPDGALPRSDGLQHAGALCRARRRVSDRIRPHARRRGAGDEPLTDTVSSWRLAVRPTGVSALEDRPAAWISRSTRSPAIRALRRRDNEFGRAPKATPTPYPFFTARKNPKSAPVSAWVTSSR